MDTNWFLIPKPNPTAGIRLFCFPFAGGGASAFIRWPGALPPWIELVAVQLPGRENRLKEPPFLHVEPLTDELFKGILPFLDKNFILYGHSMGGLLAFELARKLRRENANLPACLMLSASKAPQSAGDQTNVWKLPDDRFIDTMKIYGGLPTEFLEDEGFRKMILAKLRADVRILDTYRYTGETPFRFPIAAFSGEDDCIVAPSAVDKWRHQTSDKFSNSRLPGGHFFIQDHCSIFLSELRRHLESFNPVRVSRPLHQYSIQRQAQHDLNL